MIFISGCASVQYNFSLKNTLSVFLLNNENGRFFCIPVQYMDYYQIEKFDFNSGNILIGDYEILLNRNDINIFIYLNEEADETGGSDNSFNMIYSEKKGQILLSNMEEPQAVKQESDGIMKHYYIFIEKYLSDDDIKNIIREYKKGNVNSRMIVEYDLVLDGEPQNGNGMLDDFELYDGAAIDPQWFPPNLNFFKAMYLR